MKIKLFFILPVLIFCRCSSTPSNQNTTTSQVKPIEELIVGTWQNEMDGDLIAFYTDKIVTSKNAEGVKDGTYTFAHDGKIIELQFKGKDKVQSEIIVLTETHLKLKDGSAVVCYKRAA